MPNPGDMKIRKWGTQCRIYTWGKTQYNYMGWVLWRTLSLEIAAKNRLYIPRESISPNNKAVLWAVRTGHDTSKKLERKLSIMTHAQIHNSLRVLKKAGYITLIERARLSRWIYNQERSKA